MDLIARIQGIIIKPKDEWTKIKSESLSIGQLFTSYAAILAAIPAVCQFIGMALIGRRIPFIGWYRYDIGTAILYAILSYIFSLVTVYVFGIIINALAPTFSSKSDATNSMKLAVFSMTPYWVAGVLYLIPYLGILVFIAGLYSLYLLYVGFALPMMDTPKEKVAGYLIVSIVVMIVLTVVVAVVLGAIFAVGNVGQIY
jgi:hypothetical protein